MKLHETPGPGVSRDMPVTCQEVDDSTETASELPSPQPPEGFTSDINDRR